LEHGANVHAVAPTGRAALHYATAAGHIRVIKLLVDAGAQRDAAWAIATNCTNLHVLYVIE
jgi:ankyrin repeat protein